MKFVRSGDYLADVRAKSDLSQRQVGSKLKLHSQYVSNCERGLCYLPAKYFKKLNKIMPGFNIARYIDAVATDTYVNTKAKLKGKA
jgi:hypothetical protein